MIEWFVWIALGVLGLQILAQLILLYGLKKIPTPTSSESSTDLSLSVLVAVKNEENTIEDLLRSLEEQVYDKFELILVDDGSTDRSYEIMERWTKDHARFKLIQTQEIHRSHFIGKKAALMNAMEVATFDHWVFTDGDCVPSDDQWLGRFASAFTQGAEVVIGTGYYRSSDDGLHLIYAAQQVLTSMLYHSVVGLGKPYMCVGRSMAYTRQAFDRSKGFAPYSNLATGSDDLLLQSFDSDTRIESVPAAFTWSDPPADLRTWVRQRSRHTGASRYYPRSVLFALTLYDVTVLLSPLCLLLLPLVSPVLANGILLLFVVRMLVLFTNLHEIIKLGGRATSASQVWLLEYPASWMNALISVATLWVKKKAWKGDPQAQTPSATWRG